MQLHFSDGAHLKEIMAPLVQAEADHDRVISEKHVLSKLEIKWSPKGITRPGVFAFHKGDASFMLTTGDFVLVAASQQSDHVRFRIVNISDIGPKGQRVVIEFDRFKPPGSKGKPPQPPPEAFYQAKLYNLRAIWNGVAFERRLEALTRFAEDENCCDEAVYHTLLGHGSNEESQFEVPEISPPGLPDLNHSQVCIAFFYRLLGGKKKKNEKKHKNRLTL